MRFLFAWELGSGLGHVVPLGQIAKPLLAAGHRIDLVLKDLSSARTALPGLLSHPGVRLWQAPVWLLAYRAPRHPVSYAELLFEAGYLDAGRLLGLVLAWRSLFELIEPDFMLVDHAPTALLAARDLPFPSGNCGSGFFVPPSNVPMPPFAEWEPVDPARVAAAERLVVDTCNAVQGMSGNDPLGTLSDVFSKSESFLLTCRELDHYGHRSLPKDETYWGAVLPEALGGAPTWPQGDGKRLFAYLKSAYGPTKRILQMLAAGPWRTHAYTAGISTDEAAKLESPYLRISNAPADMNAVAGTADAALCHGNFGTVSQLLGAGLPLLLLPMQAEQLLVSRRVATIGAGMYTTEDRAVSDVSNGLRRLATESVFTETAKAFARKYAPGDGDVAMRVAQRCEALAHAFASTRKSTP